MTIDKVEKTINDFMLAISRKDTELLNSTIEIIKKALKNYNENDENYIKELEKRVSDAGWQYEKDHINDWHKIHEMGE